MALLAKGTLIFGLARKGPDQNPKETKKGFHALQFTWGSVLEKDG